MPTCFYLMNRWDHLGSYLVNEYNKGSCQMPFSVNEISGKKAQKFVRKTKKPQKAAMEGLFYNSEAGYLEGIVRGLKSGILNSTQYFNFTQCETLEGLFIWNLEISKNLKDLKLQLAATDYGTFLQNEPSPLSTTVIAEKARDKLISEFFYLRAHANQPLATFLDYLTYSFIHFIVY